MDYDNDPVDRLGLAETGALDHVNETFGQWMDMNGLKEIWQEEKRTVFDNPSVRALAIVIYSLLGILCFAGNLAVVVVTTCHADMKVATKRYYLYFGHLAFANLCVGIFCIFPNLITYLHYSWILGECGCKLYHFIASVFENASVFIFLVFSFESYLAIVQPCTFIGRISGGKLKTTLVMMWILSLLASSPKLYYYQVLSIPDVLQGKVRLLCIPVQDLFNSALVESFQFIFLFLLPFLAVSCLHLRIRQAVAESCKHDLERVHYVNGNLSCSPERRPANVTPRSSFARYSLAEESVIGSRHSGSKSAHRTSPDNVEHKNGHVARIDCEISLETFIPVPHGIALGSGFRQSCSSSSKEAHPSREEYIQKRAEEYIQKSPGQVTSMESQGLSNFSPDQTSCRIYWNKCPGLAVKRVQHPQKDLVRMLALAVVSFVICNLPFHLRKLVQNLRSDHKELQGSMAQLFAPFTYLLIYTNCAVNPVIFGYMSKHFRTCFEEILRCRCRKQSRCDFYW